MKRYIVQNIKLPIEAGKDVVFANAERRLLTFFGRSQIIRREIFKKSIDARKRDDIKFVWSVIFDVETNREYDEKKLARDGIVALKEPSAKAKYGSEAMEGRPIIVGFGPCGMFCALMLARNGYYPIVIERGGNIEQRTASVEHFYKTGELDENSNIQFGAGGAGTFSDGKLVTRINDEKCALVIDEMHRHGAPDDILYKAKPHVGTDYLKKVVTSIEREITSLGGEIFYNTSFLGFEDKNGKITSVNTSRGQIKCGALILALGHSARDTFSGIINQGVAFEPKAFSVGVRVEHLQKNIDESLYGNFAGDPRLPKGEYALSHRCDGGRGVYTFCMCPGGEVVAATSETGGIVTNGMSNYLRDNKNSNSAVCVSVLPDDFGGDIYGAIDFQRKIEQAAYGISGSYSAPVMSVGHFLGREKKTSFSDVYPSYMNGNVVKADFRHIFPNFVVDGIYEGLLDFDRKIRGFASSSAILTAPETRTSSPVRMTRGETLTAIGFDNLYPAGEGAGYAGGITSAGVDGINCALRIMERYKNTGDRDV